ncbi:MAG TPA: FtsQ-type POTRA domain-containing protein [Baekduia sp.]|nr:FtsQ-type POTRA domain-containing protein [Baekduia sp.]
MEHVSKIRIARRRVGLKRLAWVCALTLLVVVGGAWFRDSSLVAVKHVTVNGATGQEAKSIRAALESAAADMTTLHLRQDELRTAVEPYPSVAAISVERHFPNSVTISVTSRQAVAALVVDEARRPVAADGVILRGDAAAGLPIVAMRALPTGPRVTNPRGLQVLAILGAAPKPLLAKVKELGYTADGIVVRLTKGPELRFGSATRPNAKWLAISRVLADPSSAHASYIDVHLPERPAAGGLEDPSTQQDPRTADDAVPPAGSQHELAAAQIQTPPTVPQETNSQ